MEYTAMVGLPLKGNVYQQPHFMRQEWGAVGFQTVSESLPLRIGVIGDSGLGERDTFALADLMATHDLNFVLHTGDVVYLMYNHPNPFDAYANKYYFPLASILHAMPIYPVVANHDFDRAAFWQDVPFYYHAFPAFDVPDFESSDYDGRNQWYGFAYGKFQFLMLDSETFFGEDGQTEQDTWLRARLADEDYDYTIPVLHRPLYSSGPHASEGPIIREVWEPLFKEARVPIVLAGHDHFYERLTVESITYIVSGGGCSYLYDNEEPQAASQVYKKRMHFVLMEIHADWIEVQAIGLDGEIFDETLIPLG
jgi:acid phosphatase